MSEATLPAAGPSSGDSLHLVLFGLPSAGKSSLLGALAQTANHQDQAISGRFSERGEGLTALQKNLYQGQYKPTSEEVVEYPMTFESPEGSSAQEAVLVDCNGRTVSDILSKPLEKRPARGSLARKVKDADTLILVADGSADTGQMQRDFGQFASFLRLFEQNRSARAEVAGLPVYIVLTKCDLLAKKSDTTSAWIQRIEERKRQIDQGFHKYLAQQEDRERLAFGKIDLRVWATAVGRPALADRPARPDEPYGVAELFRQCLEAAQDFHRLRRKVSRRLNITVGGIAGLAAFMFLLAAGVYLTRPGPEVAALESSLSTLVLPEGAPAAERLKEPLDDKLAKLKLIRKNEFFSQLSAARQKQVDRAMAEIEAYMKANQDFLDKVQDPRLARTEPELAGIEKSLHTLALPKEYAKTWKDARLGQRPQVWANDIAILRKEIDKTITWINDEVAKGEKLQKKCFLLLGMDNPPPKEVDAWLAHYKEYLDKPWPYAERTRLPGSSGMTYETVYQFDKVEKEHHKWDEQVKQLKDLRNRLLGPA
jgi:GTPase SAR1 family protein